MKELFVRKKIRLAMIISCFFRQFLKLYVMIEFVIRYGGTKKRDCFSWTAATIIVNIKLLIV